MNFDDRIFSLDPWPCGCQTRWISDGVSGPYLTATVRCVTCPRLFISHNERRMRAADERAVIQHLAAVWDEHTKIADDVYVPILRPGAFGGRG